MVQQLLIALCLLNVKWLVREMIRVLCRAGGLAASSARLAARVSSD